MKKNKKNAVWASLCLCVLFLVSYIFRTISTHNRSDNTEIFEIVKDSLYLKFDTFSGRYRIWLSRNGRVWANYIEFEKERIRNHISNVYFFPPDSLFVLNLEGETVSGVESNDLRIIDVLSEDIAVLKGSDWVIADRLRYYTNSGYVERFAPGSPRIAYRLTYDSIMCSAPVWICFEPYLKGFTICDSTGQAITFAEDLN